MAVDLMSSPSRDERVVAGKLGGDRPDGHLPVGRSERGDPAGEAEGDRGGLGPLDGGGQFAGGDQCRAGGFPGAVRV